MVAFVSEGRQCWIWSPWKRGWVRFRIEGQCLQDNACFCLALRAGKDGWFSWSIDFSFSEAIKSLEIINALSDNPLSVFLVDYVVHTYMWTYVYIGLHTCACAHSKGEETWQTCTHELASDCWQAFSQQYFPPVWVKRAEQGPAVHEKHPLRWPMQVLPLYYFITFCLGEFCSYGFKIINLFSYAFPIQIGLRI